MNKTKGRAKQRHDSICPPQYKEYFTTQIWLVFLDCWHSCCFLTSLLQYLVKMVKNMALIVQKFCGGFFLSEFVSGYFKTKNIKSFGGGVRTLKRELFLAASPKIVPRNYARLTNLWSDRRHPLRDNLRESTIHGCFIRWLIIIPCAHVKRNIMFANFNACVSYWLQL